MQKRLFLGTKFNSDISLIFVVERVSLIKLVSCIFRLQIRIQLLLSTSFNFFLDRKDFSNSSSEVRMDSNYHG